MTIKATNENNDKELIGLTDQFACAEGRRPRVLVALTKSELSSQFNETSSSLADLGFDVDISPRYESTVSLSRQAVENDVHVLLVLSGESAVNEIVEAINKQLHAHERSDILLIIKTSSPLNINFQVKTAGHAKVFGSEVNTNTLAKYILHALS